MGTVLHMDFSILLTPVFMDPVRIPFAVLALIVCAVIGFSAGPVFGRAVPVYWWLSEKVFGTIGDRLNKPARPAADLMFRGFVMAVAALLLALVVGACARYLKLSFGFYGITEVLFLSMTLSVGAPAALSLQLAQLEDHKTGRKKSGNDQSGIYYALSRSLYRNLNAADQAGIIRLTIGYAARQFDKAVVAPVFWYVLLGLPGAFLYSALISLVWRFGKDGSVSRFAAVPIALERLMGVVPGMLAGLLISLGSLFAPQAHSLPSLKSWFSSQGRAPYVQGGLPLAALAWALNITLGGAAQDLSGSGIKSVWVGPASASAQVKAYHLRLTLLILAAAFGLFLITLGSAYLWAGGVSLPDRLVMIYSEITRHL